jgi:hypothetical protein
MARKLVLRFLLVFFAVGGAFLWERSRKPVDMTLSIDLSSARRREMSGIDVIVRRNGRPITRHEMQFGPPGAPKTIEFVVHAAPGSAEVESTLNYAGKPSRRVTVDLDFHADGTNDLRIE